MKIVFIACSAKKLGKPAKAKNLYISPLFQLSWRYANRLKPDKVYILSAKHGLIKPDVIIRPYNVALNTMTTSLRKNWAGKVNKQMEQERINFVQDQVVFLAGKNYYQYLAPLFAKVQLPLSRLGIGRQLKYLKTHV